MGSVTFNKPSNFVTINGLFPLLISQKSYTAQYTIKNVINPNKAYTQNFVINLYRPDNSISTQTTARLVV